MKRFQSNGFTTIELVTVIIIIGILSVFAVPKLMSLGHDARIAMIKHLHGTIIEEMKIAYEACVIDKKCDEKATHSQFYLTKDGGVSIKTTWGYPSYALEGIGTLIDVDPSFNVSFNNAFNETVFQLQPQCAVFYYERRNLNRDQPKVSSDVRGC
ncbi:Tfp pilus assembly protein FimT/FimU [Corallincola platygyrae]|uniref:Tfp pilus assembly protein FimT/FimU n=1 Tax=Corallincola platygyrae TaxID=1193278 RepID=A0ABW4XTU7_9GAMM